MDRRRSPSPMARSSGPYSTANGLRPSRYYVTKDDMVIMASEVGVLDIPPEDILVKERLHPGRIFLVDTAQGRIVSDRKSSASSPRRIRTGSGWPSTSSTSTISRQHRTCRESITRRAATPTRVWLHAGDLRILLAPDGNRWRGADWLHGDRFRRSRAVGSPAPALRLLKQVFAQVTNPPLDAIREALVTAMGSTVGPEGNLLDPRPESCRQIGLKYPVIDNDQLAKLRHVYEPGFRSITLPMLFDPREDGPGLERAIEDLKRRASDAVDAGYTILILSDRGADKDRAPIPSLLATAGVHHHLVIQGTRTRCGLVVEIR